MKQKDETYNNIEDFDDEEESEWNIDKNIDDMDEMSIDIGQYIKSQDADTKSRIVGNCISDYFLPYLYLF